MWKCKNSWFGCLQWILRRRCFNAQWINSWYTGLSSTRNIAYWTGTDHTVQWTVDFHLRNLNQNWFFECPLNWFFHWKTCENSNKNAGGVSYAAFLKKINNNISDLKKNDKQQNFPNLINKCFRFRFGIELNMKKRKEREQMGRKETSFFVWISNIHFIKGYI